MEPFKKYVKRPLERQRCECPLTEAHLFLQEMEQTRSLLTRSLKNHRDIMRPLLHLSKDGNNMETTCSTLQASLVFTANIQLV
jgi:hypothetical protein